MRDHTPSVSPLSTKLKPPLKLEVDQRELGVLPQETTHAISPMKSYLTSSKPWCGVGLKWDINLRKEREILRHVHHFPLLRMSGQLIAELHQTCEKWSFVLLDVLHTEGVGPWLPTLLVQFLRANHDE